MELTVFTPTYNRQKYIKKLLESLAIQTCKKFEWLIVDDGSTDGTQQLLQEIIKKDYGFPIRVIRQNNGGKHRAINRAIKSARGKYFFIVDSDDTLTPNAVEKVLDWWDSVEKLPNSEKYAGVAGLRKSAAGIIGGNGKGKGYIDASNLERRKYNLSGDKAEIYRTSLLKAYPFKEFEGENFLSENTVWDAIAADGYIIRWFSVPIYKCEYLQGGLTKSLETLRRKNYKGFTYQTQMAIAHKPIRGKVHMIYDYTILSEKMGIGHKKAAKNIHVSTVLLEICYMVGKLVLWKEKQ